MLAEGRLSVLKKLLLLLIIISINNNAAFAEETLSRKQEKERKIRAFQASDYSIKNEDFEQSKYINEIQLVENYLSNIKTLASNFVQTSPNMGGISRGAMYIQKPRKVRWEYTFPTPYTLIINEGDLMFHDIELDQVTYSDLPKEHPLNILTQENVKLINGEEMGVANLINTKNSLTIVLEPKSTKEKEISEFNTMSLVFATNPMKLTRIHKTNKNNETTTFRLLNPEINKTLDKELFKMKNMKIGKKRKKN